MDADTSPRLPRRLALQYGLIYAVAAGIWILASDQLLNVLFTDLQSLSWAGTLKGLGFVVVTSLILVSALHRYAASCYRSETDHALLVKRLDYLAKYANDSIALIDLDGRFIDVNDRFLATYDYTREEALRLSLREWHPVYLGGGRPGLPQRVLEQGSLVFETGSRAKDGSEIPVEISAVVIDVGGERLIQAIIRDVTERREAERKVLAVSRLYAAITAANQAIMRADSPDAVFYAVCQACVAYGGLRMAWVGLADASSETIVPRASFGEGLGYLDGLVVPLADDTPLSRGPVSAACRERQAYVCNDFIEDPVTAPWHQRAAFYGFRAAISLPLFRGGDCVGTLTAYSATRDAFDDDAVALLHDLADSLSFAIDNFARREQRRQVEATSRLSEARLIEAQAIGGIGDWSYDFEQRRMFWSPQMYHLFERDPAVGPPSQQQVLMYLDAETEKAMRQHLRRTARSGRRGEFEYLAQLPSGRQRHHAGVIVAVTDADGKVVGLQGTVQDVTVRKEVETRLLQKEAQLEEAQQVARMGSWEWLAQVGRTTWSNTLYRILGIDPGAPIPESDDLLAMLAPESRDVVRQVAEETLRTGAPYEVDLELVCADGQRKWLTCRGEARRRDGHVVGLYGTVQDVTVRRQREAERAAREQHMHELSRRLIAAQEDERRRLAAELHDRTSPNLAAVQVTLSTLRRGMPEPVMATLADEFDDLRALLQDATTSIRDVCADLRPALLDYAGLIPTLESHIQQFSRRTGTLVKMVHRGFEGRLSAETEALLFRITQEALANCAKHAQATSIRITLRRGRRRTVLTIVDDGVGFDTSSVGCGGSKPGLGLLTMRERAEFIGGSMTIESVAGSGTTIRVEV